MRILLDRRRPILQKSLRHWETSKQLVASLACEKKDEDGSPYYEQSERLKGFYRAYEAKTQGNRFAGDIKRLDTTHRARRARQSTSQQLCLCLSCFCIVEKRKLRAALVLASCKCKRAGHAAHRHSRPSAKMTDFRSAATRLNWYKLQLSRIQHGQVPVSFVFLAL